jgi:hypothetical protein
MVGWQRPLVATLISAYCPVIWPAPAAIVIGPPCQRPKLAMGERCTQLPVATVNLKLLYFFASEILLLYDKKIYVNNLLVRVDTSATSSYTPAYTNIAIYFISTAYTTTTMHTHTSFSIHSRWSTILSILCTHTQAWIVVGGKGIGGICSIMSSHWKNWQPPAWNTWLTTHSLALNCKAN